MPIQPQVSILGAGSWGTALALLLARNNVSVQLWSHRAEQVATMQRERENHHYLPTHFFPENLQPIADIVLAMQAETLLLAVPSAAFRLTIQRVAEHLRPSQAVFWATKGLDQESGELLHQVAQTLLPCTTPIGVLSGPTFAAEVAAELPTAITLACHSKSAAEHMAGYLGNEQFRVYTSTDLIGVELGGALKNVLAIASGIAAGLKLGANAQAALITRGLAEIMRLGMAVGARAETLMGLTGVGDLVLTCTDNQSRNRRLGLALGQGMDLASAHQLINCAIEGEDTARVIMQVAQKNAVDMPICEQVYRVLYTAHPPQLAVKELLSREFKAEHG